MSGDLVKYDAMCSAIAAAYQVDEVKDIRDKARAIEVYARQAKNVEAERQACEIRLRAERRAGQLLREKEKAKGASEPGTNRGATRSPDVTASTLDELGISKKQSSDWQKLGAVPDDLFETALQSNRPTTNGIIAAHATAPEPKEDSTAIAALWLWGRLKEFDRVGVLDTDPNELMEHMLPHMRVTTRELTPKVIEWLGRLKQ